MNDIAAVDAIIAAVRHVAVGGIIFFCLIGLDLILGGRTMKMLGQIFNRRVDIDKAVMSGLSSLRAGTEKKVMNVDEAMQVAKARVLVGALLLVPAVLLVMLVVAHR